MRSEMVEEGWGAPDEERTQRGVLRRVSEALGLRPADAVGLMVIAVASGAVAVNALMMQSGPHPAPIVAAVPKAEASKGAAGAESKGLESKLLDPKALVHKAAVGEATGALAPLPVARPAALNATAAVAPQAATPAARPRQQIIADLQRELQRHGLYDGTPDGVLGPKTEAAIRDIELALGWRESGEPTEALLAALKRADTKPPPPRPPLPVVDTRTVAVQRALARLGYGPVRPDGRPGGETRAAVQRFERDRNLPVTGEISDRLVRELASVSGMPIE
ncbi:peptidoglycan-binding domain-containing protein [Blastochloris sulfoviridis]|uniref:peptidoglycan-binding domain-containing protein n=1 Tax=Blastochloris sulfoviridis TaxID=50712 RepID=UPI001FEA7A2C|nr:peptidoglycan-binding protein [Blastochloris sulfoviridis]